MAFEIIEEYALLRVPTFDRSVLTCSVDNRFAAPEYFRDGGGVARKDPDALAGARVPDTRRCVLRAGSHQPLAIDLRYHGLPGNAGDELGVPFERLADLGARLALPEVDDLVHATGGDYLAVRRESNEEHVVFVAFACMQRALCIEVPEAHGRVTATRRQVPAVRTECQIKDGPSMALERTRRPRYWPDPEHRLRFEQNWQNVLAREELLLFLCVNCLGTMYSHEDVLY